MSDFPRIRPPRHDIANPGCRHHRPIFRTPLWLQRPFGIVPRLCRRCSSVSASFLVFRPSRGLRYNFASVWSNLGQFGGLASTAYAVVSRNGPCGLEHRHRGLFRLGASHVYRRYVGLIPDLFFLRNSRYWRSHCGQDLRLKPGA